MGDGADPGSAAGGGGKRIDGALAAGSARIIGSRPVLTRRSQVWMALTVGFWVVLLSLLFTQKGPIGLLWAAVPLATGAASLLRPPTVVDGSGVRRPWLRPSVVFWPEVAGVAAPRYGVPVVRLVLVSGRTVTLQDVSAEHSGAVAALGGKQILRPPVRPFPASRGGEVSDEQRELNVERRAARLAAERAEMQSRSPRSSEW